MTHDLKVTASFWHQNVAVHITSYPYTTFHNDIITPSWKTTLNLILNLLGRTYGRTDGRTDGWTDGRTHRPKNSMPGLPCRRGIKMFFFSNFSWGLSSYSLYHIWYNGLLTKCIIYDTYTPDNLVGCIISYDILNMAVMMVEQFDRS